MAKKMVPHIVQFRKIDMTNMQNWHITEETNRFDCFEAATTFAEQINSGSLNTKTLTLRRAVVIPA